MTASYLILRRITQSPFGTELQSIRELSRDLTQLPIGYCLDTCHLLAAGFDIRTPAGLRAMIRNAEETLGWSNVPVIHTNDSKAPLGSRVDRHEHIGEGTIGPEAFRRLLHDERFAQCAFIAETPVDAPGDEARNVAVLRTLAAG